MRNTRTTTTRPVVTTLAFTREAEVRNIINAYKAGRSINNLATFYVVTPPTVRRLLVLNGVKIRPRGRLSNAKLEKMAAAGS